MQAVGQVGHFHTPIFMDGALINGQLLPEHSLPKSLAYQRDIVDQAGRASCDVVANGNAGVDEGQRGRVDAGAEVAAVGLKNFDENVDLGSVEKSGIWEWSFNNCCNETNDLSNNG